MPLPADTNIGVYSYGEKGNGNIPMAQFDFDVTKLRDPVGQVAFKGLNGTHPKVKEWMLLDDRVVAIIAHCRLLANDLIKAKSRTVNGKVEMVKVSSWLSLAFHDHCGKAAGPAIAELVTDALKTDGYHVAVKHHGIDSNP